MWTSVTTVVSYVKFLHERCLIETSELRNTTAILRNLHSSCQRWLCATNCLSFDFRNSLPVGTMSSMWQETIALYHKIMETVIASIPERKRVPQQHFRPRVWIWNSTYRHPSNIHINFVGFLPLFKVTLPSGQVALPSEEVGKRYAAPSCSLGPFWLVYRVLLGLSSKSSSQFRFLDYLLSQWSVIVKKLVQTSFRQSASLATSTASGEALSLRIY